MRWGVREVEEGVDGFINLESDKYIRNFPTWDEDNSIKPYIAYIDANLDFVFTSTPLWRLGAHISKPSLVLWGISIIMRHRKLSNQPSIENLANMLPVRQTSKKRMNTGYN